jgi:hypothetical protein
MNVFRGEDEDDRGIIRLGESARLTSDRLTGIPKRIVEIETYPTVLDKGKVAVSEENAESTFTEFMREHKDVLQIEVDDLRLVSVKKVNKRWYVKYEQQYKGLSVHNATVGLDASEDGKVGTYAASYHPGIDLPTEPAMKSPSRVSCTVSTRLHFQCTLCVRKVQPSGRAMRLLV